MSLKVMTWVLDHSEITGGPRWVLFVLGEHAHDDGTESYPAVETIARRARLSRRAVQEGLRKLEGGGDIERDGVGPRGQTKWRVVMTGGADSAPPSGGADDDAEGRISRPRGGAGDAPEPSKEPTTNRPRQEGRAAARRDEAPEGFPDELRPHVRAAYVVLRDVAARRGAKAVNPRALAMLVMARPRKPIVRAAHDLAAWLEDRPSTSCRDVLARYRNWLDREEDLASLERLPGEGPAVLPGNVTPLRGGRRDAEAERRARQARRAEIARGGQ